MSRFGVCSRPKSFISLVIVCVAAGPMTKWYKQLKPNAKAACCHVAQSVIPRQVGSLSLSPQPATHATL